MKLLKQLQKFLKGNTVIAIVGFLVLLMAMRQFSKRKAYVKPHTQPTLSNAPEGATETGGHPSQLADLNASSNVMDLLPGDTKSNNGPNMLDAGAALGMVSHCSKNPNLQLRAEPRITPGNGPASQSTIVQPPHSSGLPDF
jgi:hypothetical protein